MGFALAAKGAGPSAYDKFSTWGHVGLAGLGTVPLLGIVPDAIDFVWTAAEMPFGKSSGLDLTLAGGGLLATAAPVAGDGAAAGLKIAARLERAAAKGGASALEKVVARNGGQIVEGGAQFATRREARQAASEMAGSLGSDVQAIRMRDFKQANVPWGLKDSNRVIGRQSADGLSGWRDDFLGHPQFQMGPHVNVWTNGSSFHFFY